MPPCTWSADAGTLQPASEASALAIAAAMAKAWASDAGPRVVSSAIQVHGGIGFTWESDLHFFLKRAEANARTLGNARDHRARIADLINL